MLLRDFWYVAAESKHVDRTPLARTICKQPLVLYRTEAGDPVALRNLCSHRRAPLSKGKLVGDEIECPYHGLVFDGTGRCTKIPSQNTIPAGAHITAFPVADRWGMTWVWMGDPANADPADIPDRPWRADPDWNVDEVHYFHIKAAHVLMTDNLLDLGHVAYIHSDTIGFDPEVMGHDPLVTEVTETGVRNTRIIEDIEPSPSVRGWGDFKGRVDRISISDWEPPCYTSILFANRPRDGSEPLDFRIDHFLTPETDETHHYWILVARNFRIHDSDLTQRIFAENEKVAAQDLDIVEAQQRMIEMSPDYRDMPIEQDKGLMAAHRIMEKLHRAEERAK